MMDHKLGMIIKMIIMITLTYAFPVISTRTMSPTRSPHKFGTLTHLMCAHYDPKATEESVKNNPTIKAVCDRTEEPTECFDFLGNTPKANVVYAIKTDVSTMRMFLDEVSQQATADQPPEVKSSFDTCAQSYRKVVVSLNDVFGHCLMCEAEQKDGKCPADEAIKVTTKLESTLSDVGLCTKALDGCNATIKKWMVDVDAGVTESLNKMLEVAKKLN